MCQTMTERIAGCLYGAAYGDSLGAPTENRTREQIFAKWGYVDKLLDPPMDVFARGNRAGQVTDDFSMAYTAIQTILHADGRVNDTVAKEALLAWGSDERMLTQFAGPTSQRFIRQLQGIEPTGETRFEPVNVNRCASNGGAMKIGPVACFAKERMEDALELARIICFPTHGNAQAMSAAAAVATAVSTALGGASRYYGRPLGGQASAVRHLPGTGCRNSQRCHGYPAGLFRLQRHGRRFCSCFLWPDGRVWRPAGTGGGGSGQHRKRYRYHCNHHRRGTGCSSGRGSAAGGSAPND